MLRASLSIAFALATVLAAGCTEVPRTQTKTADEVIETTPKTVFANELAGEVVLKGTTLLVRAEPLCSIVEMEKVETTTYYDKQDLPEDEKVWMGAVGGASIVPLAGGIVLLADAKNVHDSNPNERLYNPSGQEAAIGGGVALTIIGAAMAIPPIANAFRYVGGEEESKEHERQGRTVRTGASCSGVESAPRSYALTARVGASSVNLGTFQAPGKQTVELKTLAGPSILAQSPVPVTMSVYANQSFLGEVRIVDLIAQLRRERSEQDDLTWQAAEAGACDSQRTEQACQGVRRYLASFPTGIHAQEANALIARIRPPGATAPPPPPPAGGGGKAVVAEDPAKAKLEAARKAAADAAAAAAAKAEKKRQEEEAARAKKAAEDAAKAAKRACAEACAKTCGNDNKCNTSCQQETCK
jgi:hypothetical protein